MEVAGTIKGHRDHTLHSHTNEKTSNKNVCHWSDTQVSPPLTYIFLLSVFFRVVLREGYGPCVPI